MKLQIILEYRPRYWIHRVVDFLFPTWLCNGQCGEGQGLCAEDRDCLPGFICKSSISDRFPITPKYCTAGKTRVTAVKSIIMHLCRLLLYLSHINYKKMFLHYIGPDLQHKYNLTNGGEDCFEMCNYFLSTTGSGFSFTLSESISFFETLAIRTSYDTPLLLLICVCLYISDFVF